MRLISKLTLFITLSKLIIVVLFVLILPFLIEQIASEYTNYYLRQQKDKVLHEISRNGIDFYLEGERSYGSYTMLKEEYISLEPYQEVQADTIETTRRVVEQDTMTYRVLSGTFRAGDQNYLLEVGKKTATISQYNRPLQRIALYVLIGLIFLTMLMDLVFTRFLLKPLGQIIRTKLLSRKFPFKEQSPPIKTSTTDFQYLDRSLISLMDQVNEAFEKEREFTANASHELMTPISILKSRIENLMLHEDITEELQRKLTEMMKTVNRLRKIVHSLLLISRIENEQFVKKDTVSIRELFAELTEEIGHRLEEKQINLSVTVSDRVVLENSNRDLLFQCIYNLLNNAVKYNRQNGSIIVSDQRVAGQPYCLYIKDDGPGIPAAELPLIFNRFKKAGTSEGGGYGLGLAIVKSIADYHGIGVTVSSVVGEGTIFTLVFPDTEQS